MDEKSHVQRIREQFTRQADAYAENEQAKDDAAHRSLVRLCGAGPDDSVLDVACGPGYLTLAFAERCARASGLDATPALLDRARHLARARGVTNAHFEFGDATALPFGDQSFDVVACRAALHHFPEPLAVLREMRRVVRADGRLLVADLLTSDDAAKAAYHHRIEQLCDPTHVRALTAEQLIGLFADAGLVVDVDLRTTLDYELEEWMAHGGPDAAAAAEIRALFEACLAEDLAGLKVRREEGRIKFSHQACIAVARRLSQVE